MRYAYGLTSALLLGGAALSLATGLPAGAQVAQNDAQKMSAVVPRVGAPSSFADLTQQLQPAVVGIETRQQVKVDGSAGCIDTLLGRLCPPGAESQTREGGALGSGFIVSPDGYVVTNNHVITMNNTGLADTVTVKLSDKSEYKARIIGHDQASDLAVLKIDRAEPFPFVKFGDSSKARVGDWVLAIGNPFGLSGTVTAGIISSVKRETGSGAYDSYLQTDAAINSGNSGGPTFDMAGNVIGINDWIISSGGGNIGIGFAIPAETAAPIVDRLMKGQTIERGYLGVRIQPLNEDLADSLGIAHNRGEFVQAVEPGKGAANAGIKPGDVVLRVAGKDVSPEQTLSFLVANITPGTSIPIELIREGKRISVTATVGKRPSEEELAQQSFDGDPGAKNSPQQQQKSSGVVEKLVGLQLIPLTPQIARQLGAAETVRGLVINSVDASSDAGAKGLQRGDIVISANYHGVTTLPEVEAVISAAKAASRPAVLLQVQRRGQPATYIPIRLR